MIKKSRKKTYKRLIASTLVLCCMMASVRVYDTGAAYFIEESSEEHIEKRERFELIDDIDAEPSSLKPGPVVEEFVDPTVYFDVPLEKDLQDHIFHLCDIYRIDPALVMAVIYRESRFKADVIGDHGNSFGLMQIQPRWHQWRMDLLDCQDLLDPYQNVSVGIHLLAELYSYGKSTEWVLMAYNGGPSYANKMAARGELSGYAERAMEDFERYKAERESSN